MNLSEFAFRMILIFVPGIIAFKIFEKLTFHREYKASDILLGSLTFGFLCYLSYYLVFVDIPNHLGSTPPRIFHFSQILMNPNYKMDFGEILIVTVLVSVPVGLIATTIANKRVLYKIANKFRISEIVDNTNVWTKVFSSSESEWVVIREYSKDLMYEGAIEFYSNGLEKNEIMLKEVEVYCNSTGKHQYSLPRVYLNLSRESFTIEFRTWMSVPKEGITQSKVTPESNEKSLTLRDN